MIDLAIIGGGPAGLSAGLYATRGGLKEVVLFDKGMPGGQIMSSSEIENYPGVAQVISGMDFMQPWLEQSFRFGLKHKMEEVVRITKERDGYFTLEIAGGARERARAVIIATGGHPKRAGIKGEREFWGKGVSTCATCDGFFYKNKAVAVLGGGDTALEEAIYLSRICKQVYLVHRRDLFRASPSTVARAKAVENIEFVTPASIEEITGDERGVSGVDIRSLTDQSVRRIALDGVFIFVGYDVNTSVLTQEDGSPICQLSSYGEVVVDLEMKSSLDGLFAAGDLRIKAPKQVVCAASDGATAALGAIAYLEKGERA